MVIPASAFKGQRPHVVPLTGAVLKMLSGLPRWNGGDFIFSGSNGMKPISGFSRAKNSVAVIASRELGREINDWHPHDFRRSVATHLRRLGVDRQVVIRILGHMQHDVTAIYDRYDLVDEARSALDRWQTELIPLRPSLAIVNCQVAA
jgi:integrase